MSRRWAGGLVQAPRTAVRVGPRTARWEAPEFKPFHPAAARPPSVARHHTASQGDVFGYLTSLNPDETLVTGSAGGPSLGGVAVALAGHHLTGGAALRC